VLTSRNVSSLVIDSLCDLARGQNAAVACFYFDFAAQKEQSSASVLGALLKQAVRGLEEVPEKIVQAYKDQEKVIGGRGPQLGDIVKMLQITSSGKRTFVCMDALDECVPGNRVKLLDSLNKILQNSPGTRVFVTGRPQIRPEIRRRLAGRVTSLSISPKRDDIIGYIRTRLGEDTDPDAMDDSLEADILRKIPEDISEMYVEVTLGKLPLSFPLTYISRFLLVSLNIDAILQEPTISRRRQKLGAMTDGLGLRNAYDATLGRIKGQGGEKARLGMAALMWISHSERPLKADELCHALAVKIGSPDLDADNVPSIGTLLTCCQGLVTIDKEASTIRLIHFTVQEYLRAHPELFSSAHSTIAETCLSYLNSQQVKALSIRHSPDLQITPFLEYSSLYWGMHAKRELSDCAKLLALSLFNDYNSHISTKAFLEAQELCACDVNSHNLSLFSGLHCASFFGIVEIVAGLVEGEGCDINQEDCGGNTPLLLAAQNGHEGVVEILLEQDKVSLDKPGWSGQTPLYYAAENGHEGVVKILLRRDDICPDEPERFGRTALWSAARNGHEGVVKTLLRRENVDPDKSDDNGETPLWCAAEGGHEGVVEILLGRNEVDPEKDGGRGQTPLWCAAENGHEGVVKMLLGRDDVDPDKPDDDGETPLCCAAWNGHEGVVKILLGRGEVDPNKPDDEGRASLWCAAYSGHEGIVRILLGRDDIDPDKPNYSGETPLWCAAQRGREGVVKTLLGRNDVDPDKPSWFGQTPLSCAAENGHIGVVKILLGRSGVSPDKPDSLGRTPLRYASERGHAGVITLLKPPAPAAHSAA